ncbi:hypothetical protein [Mycolicibacterium stellerae]|uniref:hypothetical protein n=1 Tax=Mycolicibacterium stellerae TaxID=2358193 RepID=UPI001F23412A|nr:hypothetical protein [Mycolicibacterium stellerae]
MITTATPLTLDARASGAWARRFARTTPGLVVLIAVAVATLCIVAGVVCAAALNGRIAEQKAVLDHSEPFAYAAQNLYAASSAADAAAATAFLSGGNQTPLMRARYQQALASAASALADATAGAPDAETRKALAEVSAQLATYTGLVEAARANNAQGFPIGSAYLREASSSMQTKLLPGAEKVYAADLARVEQAQRRVGSLPMIGLALLVVALAAIAIGSVVMFKRTNRRFNLGLLGAAVVVAVVMVWIVGAVRLAAGDIERGRTEGTARFGQLAEARILAQQARTDETLQLITRGDITTSEKSFYGHIEELAARIGTASPEAAAAVDKWVASHRIQVDAYRAGDYPAAVAQALGTDPGASGAQFGAVETSLRDAIERARATMRDHVSDAGGYLLWLPTGVLVLMTVAAVATVVGLWPRLKEFL